MSEQPTEEQRDRVLEALAAGPEVTWSTAMDPAQEQIVILHASGRDQSAILRALADKLEAEEDLILISVSDIEPVPGAKNWEVSAQIILTQPA